MSFAVFICQRQQFILSNANSELTDFVAKYSKDDNTFLFFTDFVYELTQEVVDILVANGVDANGLNSLLADENKRKYSQIGGLFNQKGQSDLKFVTPTDDGKFHFGLNSFIGPVDLAGEKSGWDFGFDMQANWTWNWNNSTKPSVEDVQQMLDGTAEMPSRFRNNAFQQINYSSSTKGQIPIITLADDVSSWEVGDQIMVASTNFDSRDSEVFTIVECAECSTNQVKLDRVADYTHWGRISPRTKIDQRAEVGLLSRNVRFFGEMSSDSCQYAYTRESLNPESPNHGVSWCDYMVQMNGGVNEDMHGAHMITTAGFTNYHVSHIEIFNAGQPRLARYPIHWHHAGYVGTKGNYDDPS